MAGKVQAVQKLAEIRNLSPDEIAAFGDDKNDMEILKLFGTGVAVDIADGVTFSNDKDGAAAWIVDNVLI